MKHRHIHCGQRGFATVAVMGALVFALLAGGAVLTMTLRERSSSVEQGQVLVARNIAEAGLDRAMLKLAQDPTWRCVSGRPEFTNAPVNAVVSGKAVSTGTFTVDPIVELDSENVQITVHGYIPSATAPHPIKKTLRVVAQAHYRSSYVTGIFGQTEVKIADGYTNSYDSGKGSYGSVIVGGVNISSRGDVRTDAHDPAKISMKRKGFIHGRVMFGPGTDLKKVAIRKLNVDDGDGEAANDITAAACVLNPPSAVLPPEAKCITTISGYTGGQDITGPITIPDGIWWCNKIDLKEAGDYIRTVGKVTLYVKSDLHVDKHADGIHNNNDYLGVLAYPADFQLIALPSCGHINIHTRAPLTMVMYAPDTHIDLHDYDDDKIAEDDDDGDFYGSIIGDKVHFKHKSVGFHYDMALRRATSGALTPFKIMAWQDD